MRILWAGWGDLGQRATGRLTEAGHEVVALRRTPIEDPPPGVVPLVGDLAEPDDLDLPPDIGACIVTLTPDARDRAGYEAAYLQGVANLHRVVERETSDGTGSDEGAPLRLVFASSTAVYGQDDGSWVEEAAATAPSRFNGEVMVRAERLVLDHASTHGMVARLGGIYGPGRDRLLRTARSGEPVSTKWTNRIHSEDAAAALVHLALAPRPMVPDIVNVVDTAPARKWDVVAHVAELLGLPAPPVQDDGDAGKRVDGTRLQTTGFRHTYPTHRAGYRALVHGT